MSRLQYKSLCLVLAILSFVVGNYAGSQEWYILEYIMMGSAFFTSISATGFDYVMFMAWIRELAEKESRTTKYAACQKDVQNAIHESFGRNSPKDLQRIGSTHFKDRDVNVRDRHGAYITSSLDPKAVKVLRKDVKKALRKHYSPWMGFIYFRLGFTCEMPSLSAHEMIDILHRSNGPRILGFRSNSISQLYNLTLPQLHGYL